MNIYMEKEWLVWLFMMKHKDNKNFWMDTINSLLQRVLLGKMDLEVKENRTTWSESEEIKKQEVGKRMLSGMMK